MRIGTIVNRLSLAVITIFAASCDSAPNYVSFMKKDNEYYMKVAEACDKVRLTQSKIVKFGKFSPAEIVLPDILTKIHPSYIVVETNQVLVVVGAGRGAYGIAWEAVGGKNWKLNTYAEGLKKTVYSPPLLSFRQATDP
jgi:hypothetical protein